MVGSDGRIASATQPITLFALEACICKSHKDAKSSHQILYPREIEVFGIRTLRKPGEWDADSLARNWATSPELAKRTLVVTIQLEVRNFGKELASAQRRYPTGNKPFRYRRLQGPLFNNTMVSSVISVRGYTCGQIYVSEFCWSRFFPMKAKSDVNHTADNLFHRYGVATALISDNAKKLTLGDLARKYKIACCNIDTTDPYSSWQNRAMAIIRENKRLMGRWKVKS